MKRLFLVFTGLFCFCLTWSPAVRYSLQFKSGDVVEGELVKQNEVQVTLKLDAGKEVSYYKILLKAIEPSTEFHTKTGDEYYKNEKYAEAVKEYEKVLKSDPENEYALKQIQAVDNWYQAEINQKQAKQDEIAAALLFSQGMSYYRNNNFELASQKFAEVLKYNPNDEQAKEYLKITTQKAEEKEAQLAADERQRLETEKQVEQLQLESIREKQAEIAAATPVIPRTPVVPGAGGNLQVNLVTITQETGVNYAILHVLSENYDRELKLQENYSERVGNYRIRVKDIREERNEVEIEIIPSGTSVGQIMVLTPRPY